MHNQYSQYRDFFELLKLDKRGAPIYDKIFFMSIDTEYVQVSEASIRVLSYQVATVGSYGANNIFLPIAFNQPRMSLPELIAAGICSTDSSPTEGLAVKYAGSRVLVIGIAHYAAAELSAMRDRDEPYITNRLTLIQKSPVTDGHPIRLNIDGCLVDFHLYDTMLLAPPKYRSLESLSSLLGDGGEGKLEVSPFYKRNMDLFLRDRPDDFERYALRDSELCLKLFLLLQQTLNDVVYGKATKLFGTISSAAVSGFLRENDWFGDYRAGVCRELLS